ncbi:MAG: TolC family protein [Planctomycetes bacterium]|nr:TolC family protein [Planctomycetota bacterium]
MKLFKIIAIPGILSFVFISGCVSREDQAYNAWQRQMTSAYGDTVARTISYAGTTAQSDNDTATASRPELTSTSGLSDYLAYAALNNPGLEAAFNRWKAALEQIPQVKALQDPKFNYKYFIEEVETRVGPQKQSFGISQAFPWFGKLSLRGDIAAEAANAAKQRYESAKLKLFFDVKDVYYEYYYLSKSIAITQENVNLIKHLESVARSRYKAAAGGHPDVIRAQVEMGKLQDRYQTQLDLKAPVIARLNAALNRPVGAEVPAPSQIEFNEVEVVDQEQLAMLLQTNPELKALGHEIIQNEKRIALAKKDYYPDFTFGVNVIDTGDSIVGDPRDNGKDPVVALISINIPLWRDKYAAAKRQARHKYHAAKRLRTEQTNSLSSKLKMVMYRFRNAERKIDLYGDALLPKAKESLKVTESGFRSGQSSFTDLIDAQRILLEFALSYERALANRSQSLAEIEMIVGSEIPRKAQNKP